jgi:GNAT superfamily N-acetyltransferase
MRVLFELHQKRWREKGSKGAFTDSWVKDFYLDITKQFYDQDWLQLRVLKVNDDPISSYYNFKYNKRIYYYQSGSDPNWSKYSVGDLLLADCIKSAIQKGYIEFDFMRGAEDYKKRWGTKNKYNFRLELVNDRLSSKAKYRIFRSLAELYSPIKEKHVLIALKKVGNYLRRLIKLYIFFNQKLIIYRKSLKNSLSTIKPEIEVHSCMANQRDIPKLVHVTGLASKAVEQKFKNGELCFVAKKEEEIIHYSWICFGSIYINEIEKEERFSDSTPIIYNVFTLPQYRGKKIYPYILSQEFKYLAQEGHSYVYIYTSANNKASIRGIKRAGFEVWQIIRYIKILGIKKYYFRRHF